jgi:hypothetical protein
VHGPRVGGASRVVRTRDDSECSFSPFDRLIDLCDGEPKNPTRRVIDERIRPLMMLSIGERQRRQRNAICAGKQLGCVRRSRQFVEKDVECRIRRGVETRSRASHLGDSRAERIDALSRLPLVQAQRALDLPHWLRRDVGGEDRCESPLDPLETKQAPDVLVDGVANARRLGVGREAG